MCKPATNVISKWFFSFCLLALSACYCQAISAQPLESTIATVPGTKPGARDFNRVHHANLQNRSLSQLTVSKQMANGILVVNVHIGRNTAPSTGFLIRLFDRNGNYLSHFQTQNLIQLFGMGAPPSGAGHVPSGAYNPGLRRMEFRVNVRDLRDAEMVEFGFEPR
jgi:hypothetical protein